MSQKRRPGKPPVIIPRKISDWIRQNTTYASVNNYKVGGGTPAWNAQSQRLK